MSTTVMLLLWGVELLGVKVTWNETPIILRVQHIEAQQTITFFKSQ